MEGKDARPFSAEARPKATAEGRTNPGHPAFPELRLVLLGRKGTGKSSTGNTILGLTGGFESGRPTEECVKRKADVANRHVTVVDTPGWEWYYSDNGTPCWVTRETIRSVSLCPPGPHGLLLVARSFASVTDDYCRQVEKHLELLGKNVWAHTMLLFTRGDELGSIPIGQRIQNGGKPLKKLLERCGNRFHVLENKRCSKDETQVKELIGKIEAMVKERGERHYESDPVLLGWDVEGKRRSRERRKKQRIMEAQTQRGTIKAVLTADTSSEDLDERTLFSRGSRRLPELRLVLVGERETGKSSAGNAILRGAAYFKTGQATEECSRQQAEAAGRLVTVVDVPGWEGGPEGVTTDRVKREICASVTLCPPGPHAVLLTLRVDALVKAQAVKEHLALFGEGVWRHTMLLFTRGDQLREGVTIEQHIQGGGRDLQWLMEKCGSRYHVISSVCAEGQITGLLEKVEKMVAGNRCEAFSPIVQEIQELGRQKNERFNLKLKEVQEKLQRQETELKRMREREVKSIRWFFDRRKVKSPEKTSRERNEGTDKVEEDRKSIMGELEERMTWLTEDKERELQDLSLQNSQAITALNQARQEKAELVMNLDEKERESEELKEKIYELQVKVMELERTSMLREQDRNRTEEDLRKRLEVTEKEVSLLKEEADQKEKELNLELLEKRRELQRNQEENREFKKKLRETEELLLKTDNNVREQEERGKEMTERWETEKNRLREMIELMTKEMEELQLAFQDQVKSAEEEREMHESTVLKYNELLDKLVGKDAEISAGHRKQQEQEQEMRDKLADKTTELSEKDQEIKQLKQAIDDKHRSLESVRTESEAATAELNLRIKQLEDEYKEMEEFLRRENGILKEEMEAAKKAHEETTRKKEDDLRRIVEAKENVTNQLQRENEDRKADVEELQKSQREMEMWGRNLEKQKASLVHELEELRVKCEDNVRELQVEIAKNKKREGEIKDLLHQYEETGKAKDAVNQETLNEKEKEISLLKQTKNALRMDLEITKERVKELELKSEEMRKYYEERLSERRAEMDVKEAERELQLHKRELELSEREQAWRKNVQELERGKRDLQNQDDEISHREELLKGEKQELKDKEVKLQHERQTNQRRQEDLEIKEKEMELKHQEQSELSKKHEKELENIRHRLNEKEKELTIMEEELMAKRGKVQEETINMNKLRENLDLQEREMRRREQNVTNSEQICEGKMQELSNTMQELEKTKHDHDRRQAELNEKEGVMMERTKELHKKEEEIAHAERNLKIKIQELLEKTEEIRKRERELLNEQETLVRREQDLINTELELGNREKDLVAKEDQICRRCEECEALAKLLESKQREFSEKQEKELGNIRQKEKELRDVEEALALQRRELREEKRDAEKLKESLDVREEETTKKEQELAKSVHALEKNKHNNEIWQAELSEKERITTERSKELQKKEHDVSQTERGLQMKIQELLENTEEIRRREQELVNEQENHASALVRREQDLINAEYELEKRETDLDVKEDEIRRKYEECEALEKMLESKQREFSEKQEKELENIQQRLQEKEKEMRNFEEELALKRRELLEERKDVEILRGSLDGREEEITKGIQELEKNKRDYERWRAELSDKELDLVQKACDLQDKEKEIQKREHDLQLRAQEELGKNLEQQQQQQHQHTSTIKGQMEDVKETVDMQEGELLKKEDEIIKKEHDIRSTEIYLEKRAIVIQKREGEVQVKEQQQRDVAVELQKKQEMIETQQVRLADLENMLTMRERSVANKEQDLSRRHQELDVRQRKVEKQQADLKPRDQEFKVGEQKLASKRKYLEELSTELDKQKDELNIEKQVLQMKSEQLEKWGKYLYNMELRMINNNPRSDFQPWSQRTVKQGEKTHEEFTVDGPTMEPQPRENATEALSSQTTVYDPPKSKRALEAGMKQEVNADHEQDAEEFFTPASPEGPAPQVLDYPIPELRLMLIGEARSSRHSGRRTFLGQSADADASAANPWRGSFSGKALLIEEPLGIKWRSNSSSADMTFRKELLHGVSMCTPGPHAFVILLPAYLTFTAGYRRAVEGTVSSLGKAAWMHTVVVFTWGEALGESVQQHVKRNGDLEWLVQKCGGRCYVLDNRRREAGVAEILEKIHEMVEANGGRYYQAERP